MTLRAIAAVVLLASASSASGEERTAYVFADVLRLRAEPGEGGATVAKLRINTELTVSEERGSWSRVSVPDHGIEGWVLTSLTADAPVELEQAAEKAASTQGDERWQWAERSVALDGTSRAQWKLLRAAYAASRRVDKTKWVDQVLAGKTPGLLAVCYEEKALLIARFNGSGAVSSGEDASIEGLPWYRIGENGPELLPGTPFVRTELASTRGNQQVLTMGACGDDGALYATIPLVRVKAPVRAVRTQATRACERAKPVEGEYTFGEEGDAWYAPAFGGKLRFRVSRWHYTWSQCEEGDNCGSEDSNGFCAAGGGADGSATVVTTEFGGC
jgi:uncharacterized protein YgiM (DUF1202 family)